ncbi:MAG: PQQ-dependent sugar dehydrogenase [Trueperaceae bacterium]
MIQLRRPILLALLLALVACGPTPASAQDSDEDAGPEAGQPPGLELVEIATGFESPTTIVHAGDGSERLFVLEQPGRIRVIENGELLPDPFLDIGGEISSGGERGLLGLAFHPNYAQNGRFFIDHTDSNGDSVVAGYSVSEDDPNRADPGSAMEILHVEQPYANHNGGGLAFGPDGYLYLSLGDGGSGGDPQDNGQNLETLLGTILRIDVDGADPYAIPADNPFVDDDNARPEIWAYGLRNPWRFSFDSETGDLWMADVGQNVWEEINFQSAESSGGENYGWNIMEGAHCFEPAEGCDTEGLVMPVLEYDHDQGCSVTGGYRYRGDEFPGLVGMYVFGDYCSGQIWGASDTEGEWTSVPLLSSGLRISAFGEDEAGELYVAGHSSGSIYRLGPSQ